MVSTQLYSREGEEGVVYEITMLSTFGLVHCGLLVLRGLTGWDAGSAPKHSGVTFQFIARRTADEKPFGYAHAGSRRCWLAVCPGQEPLERGRVQQSLVCCSWNGWIAQSRSRRDRKLGVFRSGKFLAR